MEILSPVRTELGEAPFWDRRTRSLYWVDIFGRCFYRYFPGDGSLFRWQVTEMVSSVFPVDEDSCVLTLEHRIVRFYYSTGRMEPLAAVEEDNPDNRLNDAKCDVRGRLWFGSMDRSSKRLSGSLYVMDGECSVRLSVSQIGVSNGIAWSPDYRIMYYTDTQTFRVDAFDYDCEKGTISNRRIVIRIPYSDGLTDGMAVDREGMIWLALWDGGRIVRIDPDLGKIISEYPVPAWRVTSLCFGGTNMDDLFITSAWTGLEGELKKKYPDSGALFHFKPGVTGLEAPPFKLSAG